MRRVLSDRRGQATVEFALVLPILVFLLLAIMEGSRIFAGYVDLQNAARDGARYAAVHPSVDEATLRPWVKNRLAFLNPDDVLVSFAVTGVQDKTVTVSLTYPLHIVTPIISSLVGDPVNLQTSMAMRRE